MPGTAIQFRAGFELEAFLKERVEPGRSINQVVARDIERYYQALDLARAQVDLTQGEASLIVDALNGTFIDMNAMQFLAMEIEDSLADGLAEKWGVDGLALVQKLKTYSLLQKMAIVDSIERFWKGEYHTSDMTEKLTRAGLLKAKV